ncbi:MAG: ATP-binding cassette domain-containing protein [Polyangiales bacterium]
MKDSAARSANITGPKPSETRDARISGIAPARETLLEISGLSHRFGDVRVLEGLHFQVARGEIFGLLGPNGCGKSTTLRVLTGLLVPDAGELRLLGQNVAPGGRALRQRMGVVFQAPSLDQRLSVRENLQLTAALQRLPKPLAEQRVTQALEHAQLTDRAAHLVKTLSGGMRRRLELARALLHEPELLLLDEPTTGLDEPSFRRTWQRILELRERAQLSVLLTTHRAEEAALCDRVAILDQGKLIALDTPEALIAGVAGDVLTLEVDDPEAIVAQVEQSFQLPARVAEGKVLIERERGHELIPRLVEALPAGSIRSLSMHRPTLADVFMKLTGRALDVETQDSASTKP